MENLKSSKFEEFKLQNDESKNVFGGAYTNGSSDTNTANGFDISFHTFDKNGNGLGIDTEHTGTDTRDKPLTKVPSISEF